MATLGLIEYQDADPGVRAVYDDIMGTRKTDTVNNFWKAIPHDPATLKRTWEDLKQIMAPGALDPLTKELIYIAVSVRSLDGNSKIYEEGRRLLAQTNWISQDLSQRVAVQLRAS